MSLLYHSPSPPARANADSPLGALSNSYFNQVELLLRRSLGVSETAKARVEVKPAPPIETGPVRPAAPSAEKGGMPPMGDFANWAGESRPLSLARGKEEADWWEL